MSKNSLDSVLQYLRRVALIGHAHASDAGLLDRFARQGDEGAFELLVALHGPMVLGVCRRLLAHEQDSEDAFQATFLTLARKAGTIANKETLASWLHKVACRAAYRVRAGAPALTNRIPLALDRAGPDQEAEVIRRDIRAVLDQEIAGLAERYHRPIVLCYLEGKSHEEAARLLGCPKSTIATRLARAREQLRRRLSRRGWTVSVGLLSTVLTEQALAEALSGALARSTIQAVLAYTSGRAAEAGALSAKVLALSEGVIRMMWLNKMKLVVGVVMGLILAGAGVGLVVRQTWAGGGQDKLPTARNEQAVENKGAAVAGAPPLKVPKELLQKRVEAAQKVWEQNKLRIQNRGGLPVELFGWSERWLEAELTLFDKESDRVKALKDHLDRTRYVERITEEFARAGQGRRADADAATYYRLEAEIRLFKEGVEPDSANGPKEKREKP